MKISELIEVLESIKKDKGDHHIWRFETDFPCPSEIELELTKKLKRTDHGFSGGKSEDVINCVTSIDYEGVEAVGWFTQDE